MIPASITLVGARGGHGTTTVATALAIVAGEHTRTRLVSTDAAALLGLPEISDGGGVPVTDHLTLTLPGCPEPGEPEITVIDGGALGPGTDTSDPSFVVLRGPCYLGLRHLVARAERIPAGVILVSEPGRSLTRRDVEDVVGAPVVATIAQHPAVARTIDAGLLASRVFRLPQLRELRTLAQRLFGLPGSQEAA